MGYDSNPMKNNTKGNSRIWGLLGLVVASQLYFVQELLVELALFAIVFAAIAFLIASLYLLHEGWEAVVARVRNP